MNNNALAIDSLVDENWGDENSLAVPKGLPDNDFTPMGPFSAKDDPAALDNIDSLVDSSWDDNSYGVGDALVTAGKRFLPTMGRMTTNMAELAGGAAEYVGKGLQGLEDIQRKAMNVVGLDFPEGQTFGEEATQYFQESQDISQGMADNLTKTLQSPEYSLPPELRQHVMDNPKLALDPRWLIVNASDAAASMVPAFAFAAFSGPAAGGAIGGFMEGGGSYHEMVSKGVPKEKALTAATAYALTSGFLNSLGFEEMLTDREGMGLVERLVGYGSAAAVEGGTEGAEEPFQAVFQAIAEGKKTPEIYADFKESLKNSLDVMISAGVIAPLGGMASDVMGTNANASPDVENIVDTVWDTPSEVGTEEQAVPGADIFYREKEQAAEDAYQKDLARRKKKAYQPILDKEEADRQKLADQDIARSEEPLPVGSPNRPGAAYIGDINPLQTPEQAPTATEAPAQGSEVGPYTEAGLKQGMQPIEGEEADVFAGVEKAPAAKEVTEFPQRPEIISQEYVDNKYKDILGVEVEDTNLSDDFDPENITLDVIRREINASDNVELTKRSLKAHIADKLGNLVETSRYESTEDGRRYEDYIDGLIREVDSYHKPLQAEEAPPRTPQEVVNDAVDAVRVDKPGSPNDLLKEQKKYLLKNINQAVVDVKNGRGEGDIVIQIPEDGEFTLPRSEAALINFRNAVKKKFPETTTKLVKAPGSGLPARRGLPAATSKKRVVQEGVTYTNPYKDGGRTRLAKPTSYEETSSGNKWFSERHYIVKKELAPVEANTTIDDSRFEEILKPTNKKLVPVAISSDGNMATVVLKGEDKRASVNADYFDPIRKAYPEAELYEGEAGQIVFVNNGEPVAAVMPTTSEHDTARLDEIEGDGAAFSPRKQEKWYFSALTRAAENTKQDSLPAQSWVNALKKQPNVKQEEIEWTGLADWLQTKKGKVSREEVVTFLKEGGVQIEEVQKGKADIGDVEAWWDDESSNYGEDGGLAETPFNELTPSEQEDAVRQYQEEVSPYNENATKYGDYQLEGEKEDYREVLLKLPVKEEKEENIPSFSEWMRDNGYLGSERDKAVYEYQRQFPPKDQKGFQSDHWRNDPNVLAHIRLNTREVNGEKVLFIEEIQSDWNLARRKGEAVPKAPFVQDASWQNLVMKRIMRMAAEEGFDRVAWVTGEQTADRYSLDKKLDRIEVEPRIRKDGVVLRDVTLFPTGRGRINLTIKPSGIVHMAEHPHEQFIAKFLDQIIGKDIAKKIMNTDHAQTLEGSDLKIEAKWARELYDKAIPSWMKKFTKASPEMITLDTGTRQLSVPVTAKVKEKVMQGQPLFTPKRGTPRKKGGVKHDNPTPTDNSRSLQAQIEKYTREKYSKDAYQEVELLDSFAGVAKKLEKVFGKKIVFFARTGKDAVDFNGVMFKEDPHTVYVNVDGDYHVHTIIGHELLHTMRRTVPDVYKKFLKVALSEMYSDEFAIQHLELAKQRADMGKEMPTKQETYEEMLGDFLGENFTKESFWTKLAEKMPESFRTIYNMVTNYLNKIKTKMKLEGMDASRYFRDVQKVQDAATAAFAEFSKAKTEEPSVSQSMDEKYLNLAKRYEETGDKVIEDQLRGMVRKRAGDAGYSVGPVYHGGADGFTVFDWNKMGEQGTTEGKGFYFSNDKEIANGYADRHGGRMLSTYLKGGERFNGERLTFTKPQIRNMLKKLHIISEKNEEWSSPLWDYGDIGSEGLNKVLAAATDNLFEYSQDDASLIAGMVNAGADPELVYKVATEVTGKTGIVESAAWGKPGHQVNIATDKSNIKVSDLITRDDNGDIIPLSKRFTQESDDIRFSPRRIIQLTKQAFPDEKESRVNWFKYWIADRNAPLQTVQKSMKVTDATDIFLKETQRPKITAAKLLKFKQNVRDPLIQAIADSGLEIGDVESYVHALHAEEANEVLKYRNAKMKLEQLITILDKGVTRNKKKPSRPLRQKMKALSGVKQGQPEAYYGLLEESLGEYADKDGVKAFADEWHGFASRASGMTNEEARDIIKQYKDVKGIDNIAKTVHDINNAKLEIIYEAGLLPKEEYEKIKNSYENYVPLFREGYEGERASSGAGIQPGGRMIKVRGGSTRNVVNILANTIDQYENAVRRADKAKSQKAFVDMVKANPNNGIFTVVDVKKAPRLDTRGNLRMYPSISSDVSDNQMRVMVGGAQKLVEANRNNENAMRALRTLKGEGNMPAIPLLSTFNRYLAEVNTSFAPEFLLSNPIRDFFTAMVNLQDTKLAGKTFVTMKKVPGAMKAMLHNEMGHTIDPKMKDYIERFKASGGKISWADVYGDIEGLAKKLASDLEYAKGKRPVRATMKKVGSIIEHTNTALENGTRLAAFITAVENGMTDERAGQLASDLTVDFSKKGAAGPLVNSLYLFANANIQGSARVIRAMGNKKVQAITAGIVVASMLNGMFNAGAGDDDDDVPYIEKVPDYIRERNMSFVIPGTKGKMINIPLPWGYNVFWNFGQELARMMTENDYKTLDGSGRLVASVINSFNPVASGTLLQTISPTIADPLVSAGEEKTWYGAPLMPPQNPFGPKTPDSQRAWESTRPQFKIIAEALNKLTLGDKYRPGLVDVSPETLEMLAQTIGGSMVRTYSDIADIPLKMIDKEHEMQIKDIPFVRRLAGEPDKRFDSTRYYDILNEMAVLKSRLADAPTAEERREILLDKGNQRLKAVMPLQKSTDKRIKALKKKIKGMKALNADPRAIKKVEDEIDNTMKQFNKAYREVNFTASTSRGRYKTGYHTGYKTGYKTGHYRTGY